MYVQRVRMFEYFLVQSINGKSVFMETSIFFMIIVRKIQKPIRKLETY